MRLTPILSYYLNAGSRIAELSKFRTNPAQTTGLALFTIASYAAVLFSLGVAIYRAGYRAGALEGRVTPPQTPPTASTKEQEKPPTTPTTPSVSLPPAVNNVAPIIAPLTAAPPKKDPLQALILPEDPMLWPLSLRRLFGINVQIDRPSIKIDQIFGGVCIGDNQAYMYISQINPQGFRSIIGIYSSRSSIPSSSFNIRLKTLPGSIEEIRQRPPINQWNGFRQGFTDCLKEIEKAVKEEVPILIYTAGGLAPSVMLLIAYLVTHHDVNPEQALNFIKGRCKNYSKKYWEEIDPFFMQKLGEYAEEVQKIKGDK